MDIVIIIIIISIAALVLFVVVPIFLAPTLCAGVFRSTEEVTVKLKEEENKDEAAKQDTVNHPGVEAQRKKEEKKLRAQERRRQYDARKAGAFTGALGTETQEVPEGPTTTPERVDVADMEEGSSSTDGPLTEEEKRKAAEAEQAATVDIDAAAWEEAGLEDDEKGEIGIGMQTAESESATMV